jgi:hypothetical protein
MSPSNASSARDRLNAAASTRAGARPASPATPPPARGGRVVKYTVQLDQTDEDTIQDFVYRARRELGMQVDKSDAYRAFLALLRDDPELVERVRAYIVAAKTTP